METTGLSNSVQKPEQFDTAQSVENNHVSNLQSSTDFSDEDSLLEANENNDLGIDDLISDSEPSATLTMELLQGKSDEQIVKIFEELLANKEVQNLRRDAELIKVAFYKTRRATIEAEKKSYVEANSTDEGFTIETSEQEAKLKELFAEYRSKRDAYTQKIEAQKESNYTEKLAIIEELKELVNSSETINHTFAAFRELQTRWKESGSVPKTHIKDLWENYNLQVENFYNFIKINKELRDLDLKKNYEIKLAICEDAEALLLESSVITMFHSLQKLHDAWRETGPVAPEYKELLWDRFKSISTKINKAHQDHFDAIKEEQANNLQLKTELCAQTKALIESPKKNRREWEAASDKLIEIQKVWKTIGFAPKKENNAIYAEFRTLCDNFFNLKGEFYSTFKNDMENNLNAKTLLCIQAEAISESEDWKEGTEQLLNLQKQWKETGPVPRKNADAIWKRFRVACDKFFNKKSEYFTNLDSKYFDNLNKKQEIIAKLKTFNTEDCKDPFEELKHIQKEWAEIGYVPIKFKDSIQTEYRTLIDKLFEGVESMGRTRKLDNFKRKVSKLKSSDSDRTIRNERDKLSSKIEYIKSDIALWENNIGFFTKSKNAQSMIDEVNLKITRAKKDIETLKNQISILDSDN